MGPLQYALHTEKSRHPQKLLMRKKSPAGNMKWHRRHAMMILIIEIVKCLIKSHHLPAGLSGKTAKSLYRLDVRVFSKACGSVFTCVLFAWVLQRASRFTFIFKKRRMKAAI